MTHRQYPQQQESIVYSLDGNLGDGQGVILSPEEPVITITATEHSGAGSNRELLIGAAVASVIAVAAVVGLLMFNMKGGQPETDLEHEDDGSQGPLQ